ncbi:hypothetical protein BH10PSE9_BH10PSE9_02500 [soil metagenome]
MAEEELPAVQVRLDFDRLREIARLGVRRATVFMGIGTNAARIEPPIRHALDDKAQLTVVPPAVSPEIQKMFVAEFESWVIANGFRDLVETFSVFLTGAYAAYDLFEKGKTTRDEHRRVVSRFERLGIEDQMRRLTELLALDGRFLAMFASLNQARNCLAHRQGVVGMADTPASGQPFDLVWRTRTMMLEDGRDVSALLREGEEVLVEGGQKISFVEVERTKRFRIGEVLRLSRHELSEICFGVTVATEYVTQGLVAFGKSKGLVIEQTPPPAPDQNQPVSG